MRFQVKYPSGATHEVELQGTIAILGRDPTCDLVLNDIKCSRRHAVVEEGPDGLSVRDTGSSNGVFVNGRRVDRSGLREGDILGLGDIVLTMLPEDIPRTLSMRSDEVPPAGEATTFMPKEFAPPPPPPPPPSPAPLDFPYSPSEADVKPTEVGTAPSRPLTVTVLALLWMVSGLLYAGGGVAGAFLSRGVVAIASVCAGVLFVLVAGLMAWGLLAMKSWARSLQIVLAALGLPLCPFSCTSVAVLIYMLQAHTRASFSQDATHAPSPKEGAFTAAVLGTALLGGALAVVTAILVTFFGKGALP